MKDVVASFLRIRAVADWLGTPTPPTSVPRELLAAARGFLELSCPPAPLGRRQRPPTLPDAHVYVPVCLHEHLVLGVALAPVPASPHASAAVVETPTARFALDPGRRAAILFAHLPSGGVTVCVDLFDELGDCLQQLTFLPESPVVGCPPDALHDVARVKLLHKRDCPDCVASARACICRGRFEKLHAAARRRRRRGRTRRGGRRMRSTTAWQQALDAFVDARVGEYVVQASAAGSWGKPGFSTAFRASVRRMPADAVAKQVKQRLFEAGVVPTRPTDVDSHWCGATVAVDAEDDVRIVQARVTRLRGKRAMLPAVRDDYLLVAAEDAIAADARRRQGLPDEVGTPEAGPASVDERSPTAPEANVGGDTAARPAKRPRVSPQIAIKCAPKLASVAQALPISVCVGHAECLPGENCLRVNEAEIMPFGRKPPRRRKELGHVPRLGGVHAALPRQSGSAELGSRPHIRIPSSEIHRPSAAKALQMSSCCPQSAAPIPPSAPNVPTKSAACRPNACHPNDSCRPNIICPPGTSCTPVPSRTTDAEPPTGVEPGTRSACAPFPGDSRPCFPGFCVPHSPLRELPVTFHAPDLLADTPALSALYTSADETSWTRSGSAPWSSSVLAGVSGGGQCCPDVAVADPEDPQAEWMLPSHRLFRPAVGSVALNKCAEPSTGGQERPPSPCHCEPVPGAEEVVDSITGDVRYDERRDATVESNGVALRRLERARARRAGVVGARAIG